MTCEAFSPLKHHIHHYSLTVLNDFSGSYCLKKPKFSFALHTEWFWCHLQLLQPHWPQQPRRPRRPQWAPVHDFIKNIWNLIIWHQNDLLWSNCWEWSLKKSHVLENFENISIGGCGGQPLHSKSILKVVSQMVEFCDIATALFSYLHIGFLTFLALLKNYFWDGSPCS